MTSQGFLLLTEALLVNSSCPDSGFFTHKTVVGLRTAVNFQSTINHPSSRPSIIILGLKFSLNGYFNGSNSSPTKTSQCFLRKSRGLFFLKASIVSHRIIRKSRILVPELEHTMEKRKIFLDLFMDILIEQQIKT